MSPCETMEVDYVLMSAYICEKILPIRISFVSFLCKTDFIMIFLCDGNFILLITLYMENFLSTLKSYRKYIFHLFIFSY